MFISKLKFDFDYISLQLVVYFNHKQPHMLDNVQKYCKLIGKNDITCPDKNDITGAGPNSIFIDLLPLCIALIFVLPVVHFPQ